MRIVGIHHAPVLSFTPEGFSARNANGVELHIQWKMVRRIVAFKRDLLTREILILGFELDGPVTQEISEEWRGFGRLCRRLEEIFSISPNWYVKAVARTAKPTFQTLYDRSASTGLGLDSSLIEREIKQ